MTTKRALTVNPGDIVLIDGSPVEITRVDSNVALIWMGELFGQPYERSYGLGGDDLVEIIEPTPSE